MLLRMVQWRTKFDDIGVSENNYWSPWVRRDGIQSTWDQVGIRWENREEKEEYLDAHEGGFYNVVEKQVEVLFIASIFLV